MQITHVSGEVVSQAESYQDWEEGLHFDVTTLETRILRDSYALEGVVFVRNRASKKLLLRKTDQLRAYGCFFPKIPDPFHSSIAEHLCRQVSWVTGVRVTEAEKNVYFQKLSLGRAYGVVDPKQRTARIVTCLDVTCDDLISSGWSWYEDTSSVRNSSEFMRECLTDESVRALSFSQ